jgi:anaerobic selenocysteine-containing dehydrogenase
MIRRQFIKLATLTGTTGLATFGALKTLRPEEKPASGNEVQTVTWRVRGFTCVTCAVGLETLLRREKGVVTANATYPQGMVTIQYHPDLVSQNALRSTIAELGFTADRKDD